MKRKALGKGLRSLIPEAPAKSVQAPAPPQPGLTELDLDRIVPNRKQPRERFEQQGLEELAASMKQDGVLQPVIVRPIERGEYELIAGERRWRAAQMAGLLKIPVIVKEVADDRLLELALIENLQREELNPIEEATAFQMLIDDLGLTQQQVADRVGKQRTTVTNSLRLLSLPPEIQSRVRDGELTAGHAKILAGLSNAELQAELARRAVRDGLSVRQLESVAGARRKAGPKAAPGEKPPRDPNVLAAEEELQRALGTKVRIVTGKDGAGRIELHCFSAEELERVYQLILKAPRRPPTNKSA